MKDRRKGTGAMLLTGLVVVGLVGGLFCGGVPGTFAPLPRALEPLREHLVAVGVLGAEAVVIVLSLVPGLLARSEDDDFLEVEIALPRRWVLERVGLTGRHLQGREGRRLVDVVTNTGRHSPFVNPGLVRIYVQADAGRRVHLTTDDRQGLVADVTQGLNLLPLPDLPELRALAKDGAGARRWLGRPEVAEAAERILRSTREPSAIIRVEPDAVGLHLVGQAAHAWEPADLDAWVADLGVLADGLEAVGAPTPPEETWPAEHIQHHDLRRQSRRSWGVLVGCLGCLGVVLLVSAGLVLLGALVS